MNIETLKRHYPNCAKIFDQIINTKASEQDYRNRYKKELQNAEEETKH